MIEVALEFKNDYYLRQFCSKKIIISRKGSRNLFIERENPYTNPSLKGETIVSLLDCFWGLY